MDDIDQLFAGIAAQLFRVALDGNEMAADMILENDRQQAVHGAAAGGDLLEDVDAVPLLLHRALYGIQLSTQAPDPVQQFLLLLCDMSHDAAVYTIGGYSMTRKFTSIQTVYN